jgi:imidazoleglycerol-phosphate dehydratase
VTILTRETRETRFRLELNEDGTSTNGAAVATGDAFLDHMLATLTRYADLALAIEGRGDLRHHLVEDAAITLGTLLDRTIPATCARYGHAVIPMDDALVEVALDAGGRPHFEGRLPSRLYEHFFRSLALHARWTLHVRVLRGRDRHHVVEAAFKALGLALRQVRRQEGAVFSTKGAVRTEWAGSPDREASDHAD